MRRVRSQFLQSWSRPSTVVRNRGTAVGGVVVGACAAFWLAAGPALAADCPNAAIRTAQGPGVEALPDCMALEMASPPKKFSQNATTPMVSDDGSRVLFLTRGALEDPPGSVDVLFGDAFVASRGGSGWSGESTVPPAGVGPGGENMVSGWSNGQYLARSFGPDLSRWLVLGATSTQADVGVGRVFAGGLGGLFSPLAPLLEPLDGGTHRVDNLSSAQLQGASADHSLVAFRTGDASTTYLPGDPSPSGSSDQNVYLARLDGGGRPSLELLARDGEGKVWGGRCGARVGGNTDSGGAGSGRSQGAVSADGGRMFFSIRPGQTGVGVCDTAANELRVMRRVETGAGGWISQLFASECARVAPACDATDGDDLYQGASADGARVYFTTTRQLADSDLDVGTPGVSCNGLLAMPGCDLYLYDSTRPVGQRLTQVSAGDVTNPTPGSGAGVFDGIAAISGDGSHVYFVAQGVLTTDPNPQGATATAGQRNLYAYVRDEAHRDGHTAFVGTLATGDAGWLWGTAGTFKNRSYPVPANGTDEDGVEVGGDGHILAFQTQAALTADDTDGTSLDTYRYDTTSDELERVSHAAPGGTDNTAVDVGPRAPLAARPHQIGTDFAEQGRWISEDGQTIVFRTTEGWAPDDTNGAFDLYMWRNGEIYRLPGSTDATALAAQDDANRRAALSHDGSVVAYPAVSRLLPEDGDSVMDVYVARVDGGYPPFDPDEECDPLADAGAVCHGDGTDSTGVDSRTSVSSDGNAPVEGRKRLALASLTVAQRRRAARTGTLALRVRVGQAGNVVLVASGRVGKRIRRLGTASKAIAGPGAARVELRLNRTARKRLRSGRVLRVSIRASLPGARSRTVQAVLRRARK